MKILVTGGYGFIGLNLTRRLISDGHGVSVLVNGGEVNEKLCGVENEIITGITGIKPVYFAGYEVLFHQWANNDTLCECSYQMMDTNVTQSIELFNMAYQQGVRNFIFASSTAVYGSEPSPYIEGVTLENPLNIYGHSKLCFERYLQSFVKNKRDACVTVLRYCNVYGPGEERKGRRMSMIGQLIYEIQKGNRPKLFKPGTQERDWIFVDDVVDANVKAMWTNVPGYRCFNIGSGECTSFNELARLIGENFGSYSIEYIDCPFADRYQNRTQCDVSKAKREMDWYPQTKIDQGIRKYLDRLNF